MNRPPTARVVSAVALCCALGFASRPAAAGPATYDKDTKSFHFAYTFAELPGGVGSVVGRVTKPTPEQEATVKGLVGQVSAVLSRVTDGKAKIGQLDYVDDIKNADLVISLVGAPASPGWANMRAIEGRPGQIVLYYQSLQGKITQDIVNTAAHEICHYVFGLADEYDPGNFPGGCPRASGPGCLMDNYNAGARGFLGRFCLGSDHNSEPTQGPSCKEIVGKFFSEKGVTSGDPAGSINAVANATNPPAAATDQRASVVASVIGQVRARKMEDQAKGRTGSASTGSLRTFARNALRELVRRFNQDNPDKVLLGGHENQLLNMIVKAGEIIPLLKPPGLDPKVFDLLKNKAEELGRDVQGVKSASSRQSQIRSGLQRFIRDLVQTNQVDTKAFAPADQRQLVDQLARDAARDPNEKNLDRLTGVGDRTAQLDLAMAEDIIRVLDALGEPGTRQRLQFLNRIRGELGGFNIVGRDSSQFGFRRTQLITPDSPIDPNLYILTQGGVFPYSTVRDRSVLAFSRLINRAKVEFVTPGVRQGLGTQSLAARAGTKFADMPAEDRTKPSPSVDALQALADVVDQIERDRLENVAFLVPPGGLPPGVGDQIPAVRARLGSDVRVRVDAVLVGSEDLGTEARDAVVDSHGSVLTVTDTDEIGAIAQRLKNDQTSGSWVIIPQQGTFSLPQKALLAGNAAPGLAHSDDERQNELKAALTELGTTPTAAEMATAMKAIRDQLFQDQKVSQGAASAIAVIDRLTEIIGATPDDKGAAPGAKPGEAQEGENNDGPAADGEAPGAGQPAVQGAAPAGGQQPAPAAKSDDANRDGKDTKTPAAGPPPADANAATRKTDTDPESLEGLIETICKSLKSNANLEDDAKRIDYRLMTRIGQARDQLSLARKLLEDALRTPRVDPVGLALRGLGGAIHAGTRDKKFPKVEVLGPDLINLEKLIRKYEKVLEAAYAFTKDELPIYKRIDRVSLEAQRLRVELAGIEAATGLKTAAELNVGPNEYRLARFYAEGNAEFELILGLSRELPPSADGKFRHPRLRLVSDLGVEVSESSKVGPDETKSTPSLLVWRAQTPPLSPGWYTPYVTFEPKVWDQLSNPGVNFTFSVGSNRPNIQLITGLSQGSDSPHSGTIFKADGPAVVEVQVSAGSSVLGARLLGYYQKIARGYDEITPQQVDFRDDGTDANGNSPNDKEHFDPNHCDRAANDGIYTAFLPLNGVDRATEFRVFVQADTTDGKAKYIGLDDPNGKDDRVTASDRKPTDPTLRRVQQQSTEGAEGQALKFQRATSVHFRATP